GSSRRSLERGCPVLEALVLENDDLTGVQLMLKNGPPGWLAAVGEVTTPVEVGLRAAADPAEQVDQAKLLIITMRAGHNVREGSEQIDVKRAIGQPLTGGHETKEGANEHLSLRVVEQSDAFVVALACDARTVRDGDRVMFLHMKESIAPLIPDDVSCPFSIRRLVTGVAAQHRGFEVCLQKAIAEHLG